MPTKLTRRAGTFALVGAILWIVALLVAILRTGKDSESDWESSYITIAVIVFAAAICSTVLIFGLLRRSNAGRVWPANVARFLAISSTILLGLATWAWIAWLTLFTVAALVAVMRLRASSLGSALFQWLLILAWPVGIAVALLLMKLKVGPLDSYGDHYLASEIGFGTGALLFAVGLALCGLWLRGEKNVDTPLN